MSHIGWFGYALIAAVIALLFTLLGLHHEQRRNVWYLSLSDENQRFATKAAILGVWLINFLAPW